MNRQKYVFQNYKTDVVYLSNGFNAVYYISTYSFLQINNESKFMIFLRSSFYVDECWQRERLSVVLKYGIFQSNTAFATKKILKSNTNLHIEHKAIRIGYAHKKSNAIIYMYIEQITLDPQA